MAPTPLEIPDELRLVLAFVNTVDVEDGTDVLTGPAELGSWLAAQCLYPRSGSPSAADLRLALDLRTGLRALALRNNGGTPDPADLAAAERAMARLPLLVAPGVGPHATLQPATAQPVRAALAVIVAGYVRAAADGTWHRLRRCPADDCAWAFWDSSPKGTRRWCTMRVCGNRAKVRAFAQRQRVGSPDQSVRTAPPSTGMDSPVR